VLVEADGGPLGLLIHGAYQPDHYLLEQTLEAIVLERPQMPQHLCLDAGYDNPTGHQVVEEQGYIAHIRPARQDASVPAHPKRYPPRRWVVERTLAWLSRCRAILIRWDKKADNYIGFLKLACALLWFRRLHRLTVLR
jgi:transposase